MRRAPGTRRAGTISVATLLAVPVLLLVAGLVIYVALLRDSKIEVQSGADAAALAAGHALACDDLLTHNPDRARARLDRARAAADLLARANFSQGDPLTIRPNPDNDADGDIVFGHLDRPFGTFRVAGNDPHDWVGDQINAVRVTVSRPPLRAPLGGRSSAREVRARATAMLDWCVVGIAPPADGKCVPFVPICLHFDADEPGRRGWHAACRDGADGWRFDPDANQFVSGPDGIPEIEVVLGPQRGRPGDVPAAFVGLGAASPAEVAQQIRSGVNRGHLAKWGGEFRLGVHNTVIAPGSPVCPPEADESRGALEDALRAAAATGPLIWPLFSGFDEESGTVRVCGWAGARIVAVQRTPGGAILIRLQPAVVAHPAIVAAHDHPTAPAFWAGNRTICAVRLVD